MQRRSPRFVRQLAVASLGCVLLGFVAPPDSRADATDPAPPPDRTAGRVISWGGPAERQEVLTPPADLDDAVAVAASKTDGSYSNLALRADGTVVGWGLNTYGEATPPADLASVTGIDIGAGFAVALTSDGSVRTWGTNESGQLDVPADLGRVTAVGAGGYLAYRGPELAQAVCGYGLALRADGTVVQWGRNAPELGCDLLDRMTPPADLTDVVAISAGAQQAMALRADGTVVAWGSGLPTGLDGTPVDQWSDVTAISAGNGHSLGLRADHTVLAYGIWGESGPPKESDVAALSAANLDVFLRTDGTISVYRGPSAPAGSRYLAVSAGSDYGLAITASADPDRTLVGSATVQPETDTNPSGTAEAFEYTADRSGPAGVLHVYLDSGNEADRLIVGVYAAADGAPGELLSSAQAADLEAGDWNAIPIPSVAVEQGQRYWLALLSPRGSGTIRFRDRADGDGGPTAISRERGLDSRCGLPARWTTGRDFANSPASIYLS